MLEIKKQHIAYFILFFICLQSLGFALPGNIFIAFFMPIVGFFLFFYFFKKEILIKNLIFLTKYTPFVYLILFYFWAMFTVFISIINNRFYFGGFLNGFIGGLTFSVILVFLTVFILLKENFINLKQIVKFLVLFYLFVFSIGIIQYIANTFNLNVLNDIIVLFNNKRAIIFNVDITSNLINNRVQSVFDEPGNFGAFIYNQFPIILAISLSKYKLFESKILNFLSKKFLLVFAVINLFLTCSPISLIFTIIITLMFFSKSIFIFFRKNFLKIFSSVLIILILSLIVIKNINLEETYIKRILVSVPALFNIDKLIFVEPSLATRIINYSIMLKTGFNNIMTGIGYGNLSKHFHFLLQQTNMPLTLELTQKLITGGGQPAAAIFYRVFTETGGLGIFLLLTFYCRTIFKLFKTKIYFAGIIKDFKYGLFISLLFQITIGLFYGASLHNTYNIILIGISFYIIYYFYRHKLNEQRSINNICKLQN